MASFRESLDEAVRRVTCRFVEATDPANEFYDSIASPLPGFLTGQPFRDQSREALRRFACDNPNDNGGGGGGNDDFDRSLPPGSCPTQYRVMLVATRRFLGQIAEEAQQITGAQIVTGPLSNLRFQGSPQQLFITDGSGTDQILLSNTSTNSTWENIRDVVYERVDGSAVQCFEDGTPFGPVGPNDDPPRLPPVGREPIEYDDPFGGPLISFPLDLYFIRPTLDLDLQPNFNIKLVGPNFSFNANYNVFNNEINYNVEGSPNGCCVRENEEEGEEDEEPNEEQRLVAVIVTSSVNASNSGLTEVFNGTGPSLFLPDLGRVSFIVKGDSGLQYLPAISYQQSPARIPVPVGQLVSNYSILPRPQVSATVRPVYATIPVEDFENTD